MRLRLVVPAAAPRTVVRSALLVFGTVCLAIYGYAWLERTLVQRYESRAFERTAELHAAAVAAPGGGIAPEGIRGRTPRRSSSRLRTEPRSAPIGRLSVPRLRLSAMVREGVDRHTLQGRGRPHSGTALPGQAGNVGLAGHRDTFFRGLKDLRAADEIQFSTLDGNFHYVVESLRIVEPNNVKVLEPSSDNLLTLVTCYPFSYVGNAPRRYVVTARQVQPQTPLSTVE